MARVQRFDIAPIKAQRTDAGYLIDTPIVTRAGVFPYKNPDGTTRFELRTPDEVFNADSLASLRGLPITNGHPGGVVDAQNATQHAIGTVLSPGRQTDDNVVADIIIHDTKPIDDDGRRDLSCGYTLTIDETPGDWNGQHYDAVQRGIVYNHVAIVNAGRAGNARLNLDAADIDEGDPMEIRTDDGTVYPDAASLVAAFNKLAGELQAAINGATATKQALDAITTERDAMAEKVAGLETALTTAATAARLAERERISIEQTAQAYGVPFGADSTDDELMRGVVKKIRGDTADLADKSGEYLRAYFDAAIQQAKTEAENLEAQQRAIHGDGDGKDKPVLRGRALYIHRLSQ